MSWGPVQFAGTACHVARIPGCRGSHLAALRRWDGGAASHGARCARALSCCCGRWRDPDLNYHWKQLPLPRWLIVVHAIAAVAGFVLLVAATCATRGR